MVPAMDKYIRNILSKGIKMGQLQVSDLMKKYTKGPMAGKPRILKFAEKYKNGEEFELNNGTKVKFSFIKETYNLIINAEKYPGKYQKELTKARFMALKGNQYYKITDLKKTIEFDGKPDRPPAGIEGETKTVARLNLMFSNIRKKHNYKDGVPLICKGVTYYVTECIKVPGTPKSDLALLDSKGNEVVWISYKMGKSVKDFQQWGGLTSEVMQAFPQVQEFIRKMKTRFPGGLKSGDNAGMHIKGRNAIKIKHKAVYGNDYDTNAKLGRNNVSFIIQGRIDVKEVSGGYTLTSTTAHAYENGDTLSSVEDPIFFAKYTGDREQFGVKNARMVINPHDQTKIKEWLD